jgi:hypothetical protein
MEEKEKLARQRFTMLNFVRFLGVAFAFAGAANIGGKWLPEFAPWLGYFLLINGIADVFLIPALLKKNWAKSDGSQG